MVSILTNNRTSSFIQLLLFLSTTRAQSNKADKYRLCVVNGKGPSKLTNRFCPILDKEDAKVECVLGTDRIDCLKQISKGTADFSVFTSEDLVTAANSKIEVLLTNELRYVNRDNEYEVVAVFENSADIKSKHDLVDKRFCHPGYGYETDWTRILANYLEASVIPKSCDPKFSITENRIKASSEFFEGACKAGPWVNNPQLDAQLKQKYPNLCELCDRPNRCEKDDKYWGRRGSLFCLTDGAGEISWARLDDVQLHFGLVRGGADSPPPADSYSYLCPDGTTKPLNSSDPCIWVVKPWPVVASRRAIAQDVQSIMASLNAADTNWGRALLSLLETYHSSIFNLNPIQPIESYLDTATGYLNANSFSGCHPPRTIRLCTTSIIDNAKCLWMRESAAVYGIEPDIECVRTENTSQCMDAVNTNCADVVLVHPDFVREGVKYHNLKSLFYETVNDNDKYITVAITRNGTKVKNLKDLKGFKACFPYYEGVAWTTVFSNLKEKNLVDSCSEVDAMNSFFRGMCAPGLKESICEPSYYSGDGGALRCLYDEKGDVAFLSNNTINEYISNKKALEFMCPTENGCQLSWAAIGHGMVRANSSQLWLDDTLDVFLQLDKLFGRNYQSFTSPLQLFGPFDGHHDILFHSNTIRLRSVPNTRNIDNMARPYVDVLHKVDTCVDASSSVKYSFNSIYLLSFFFGYILF